MTRNGGQPPLPPARLLGCEEQPISRVEWVPRGLLRANSYNPNHVAPIELRLLAISILEDGWTQPIVARPDDEIVDGFHRWSVSGHEELLPMTGGLVPVVRTRPTSLEHQMMSTIRHNRARGTHGILKMADIIRTLIDEEGLSYEEIMTRLQMEWEEVDRLHDRGGMLKRGSRDDFNTGWVPR